MERKDKYANGEAREKRGKSEERRRKAWLKRKNEEKIYERFR